MCKYCNRLKDLRNQDLKEFKLYRKKFDDCLVRYEKLLLSALVALLVLSPNCSVVKEIIKEFKREVI